MMQPLNYQDITLKAKVADAKKLEDKLMAIGASFLGTDRQTDYYFATARGKLKYREGTIENLITHYERLLVDGVERTLVYRYDLHPGEDELKKLFEEKPIGITCKERKIFFLGHIKIHVDKLENNEQFIEIEVIDRENKRTFDHLKKECFDLQIKLGISNSDLIPTGYLLT